MHALENVCVITLISVICIEKRQTATEYFGHSLTYYVNACISTKEKKKRRKKNTRKTTNQSHKLLYYLHITNVYYFTLDLFFFSATHCFDRLLFCLLRFTCATKMYYMCVFCFIFFLFFPVYFSISYQIQICLFGTCHSLIAVNTFFT